MGTILVLDADPRVVLELRWPSTCSVFCIRSDILALLALGLFLVNNPFFGFDPLLFSNGFRLLLFTSTGHLDVVGLLLFVHQRLWNLLSRGSVTAQNQIMFLRLGGIWIIHDNAPSKTDGRCTLTDQHRLFRRFGIKLQDRTGRFLQYGIQAGKKSNQASSGELRRGIAITQPLQGGNGNAGIKRRRSKG